MQSRREAWPGPRLPLPNLHRLGLSQPGLAVIHPPRWGQAVTSSMHSRMMIDFSASVIGIGIGYGYIFFYFYGW
jgi:hypothetical protein